ncbi:MAG: hypothetical protein P8L39_10640 [Halioglobus sp.]|nr:hypothetical protein [Halioglobus sp.]
MQFLCCLAIYRNNADLVEFMQLNATTAHLLAIVRGNIAATVNAVLGRLVDELNVAAESIIAYGVEKIEQLIAKQVILIASG